MDIKKEVQLQFGKSANAYVDSTIHKDGKDLQMMLSFADVNGEEKLLDIATGGGHTANAFAPLVKSVTALDLTTEMLEAAEEFIKGNGHENVLFRLGDAENLPFADGNFNIITCRIAPHHFPNVTKFIGEAYRVLKQNGQFLLDDNVVPEDDEFDHFYNTIEKIRDSSHFRAWKKSEWLRMLEFSGFEIAEWHRFEKRFKFESWCSRMNLSADNIKRLSEFILNQPERVKKKFRIEMEGHRVISFYGEAIVLKAIKR